MSDLKSKVQKLDETRRLKAINKANKKITKQLVKDTVVDKTTGEVIKETTIEQGVVHRGGEPSYVKFYINDLILLNELPTKSSAVLWELVKNTTYENKIILNGSIKKDICVKLNIKMPTLNNTLSSFVKKEILYRLDTGVYMPNPYLFARGSWEDIHDLRMIVNYKPNGQKSVELEIDGKKAIDINKEVATDYSAKEQEELNNLINQSEV